MGATSSKYFRKFTPVHFMKGEQEIHLIYANSNMAHSIVKRVLDKHSLAPGHVVKVNENITDIYIKVRTDGSINGEFLCIKYSDDKISQKLVKQDRKTLVNNGIGCFIKVNKQYVITELDIPI